MMWVMLANAPIAMIALMAGSVVSLNLISMGGAQGGGGGDLRLVRLCLNNLSILVG
jgi:hypothetical protein